MSSLNLILASKLTKGSPHVKFQIKIRMSFLALDALCCCGPLLGKNKTYGLSLEHRDRRLCKPVTHPLFQIVCCSATEAKILSLNSILLSGKFHLLVLAWYVSQAFISGTAENDDQ